MTLIRVPGKNIRGIAFECKCGAVLHLKVGERLRCKCGREYYCDFSLHIWENIVQVAQVL